ASGATAVLLLGPGNNGGDGLFAAARLCRRGVRVLGCAVVGNPHPDGLAAFEQAGGRMVSVERATAAIDTADLVIDAIFGIRGRPGLTGTPAELAVHCRLAGTPVVAVDLPSGLDTDDPGDQDCFPADVTITFGCYKVCQVAGPAARACGEVELVDIGLADALADQVPLLNAWDPDDLADAWPRVEPDADKYARGVVGIDAGSAGYPGAGVLTCLGAVWSGAGMVRFLGTPEVGTEVLRQLPNVVLSPGRVQAMVLGSGWGNRVRGALEIVEAVNRRVPVVLDADALRYLPERLPANCLLTPHAGELARLLGLTRLDVNTDPMGSVTEAAQRTGATVLLKGATQYVAEPDNPQITIAVPGPARTAQAGSGDVVAGICGTLLAAGLEPVEAALAAASVQAFTAARLPGMPPQELARRLPETLTLLGVDEEPWGLDEAGE
ncbi:MAG: bifunctional ADP-dependent NAD(P)H-hydrate dehydratase/NAD(P)H-hydrate epimerase, partial [Propionibacteriaceae bacterium]|nr:bifunctional ADP-dependent NAD(P)H-hydrate dehydratase/NAD(P)H-hydrate epimerase [Propionibacteriaceae bacterium]